MSPHFWPSIWDAVVLGTSLFAVIRLFEMAWFLFKRRDRRRHGAGRGVSSIAVMSKKGKEDSQDPAKRNAGHGDANRFHGIGGERPVRSGGGLDDESAGSAERQR